MMLTEHTWMERKTTGIWYWIPLTDIIPTALLPKHPIPVCWRHFVNAIPNSGFFFTPMRIVWTRIDYWIPLFHLYPQLISRPFGISPCAYLSLASHLFSLPLVVSHNSSQLLCPPVQPSPLFALVYVRDISSLVINKISPSNNGWKTYGSGIPSLAFKYYSLGIILLSRGFWAIGCGIFIILPFSSLTFFVSFASSYCLCLRFDCLYCLLTNYIVSYFTFLWKCFIFTFTIFGGHSSI